MINNKHELIKAFPANLQSDVLVVINTITKKENLISPNYSEVQFYGVLLHIPHRIYYNEPTLPQYKSLTEKQQLLINCLYTRHDNGFIREEKLKSIINSCSKHSWIIPYLILLTGDYVIEILEVIKDNLDVIDKAEVKDFIANNPVLYNSLESHVVSYWNCYYRLEYPNKDDYAGFQILAYFNS